MPAVRPITSAAVVAAVAAVVLLPLRHEQAATAGPARSASSVSAPAGSPAHRLAARRGSGRVVVRWKPGRRTARFHTLGAAPAKGPLGVSVLDSASPAATAARLRARADVLWAEPEGLRYSFGEGGLAARAEIGSEPAWAADRRMTGRRARIAVIDDGVDPRHPDLNGRNKVVDGGDCTTSAPTCTGTGGLTPGRDTHGTGVAAVAAGARNGRGTVGSAPDAQVIAYQVFENDGFPDGGLARDESIAKALVAAATRRVDVANLSLGGPTDSRLLRDALATARRIDPDMVIVAAAGNDGSEVPQYPAAGAGVLSVGASEQTAPGRWTVAEFSNRAAVDVLAPGVDVDLGRGQPASGTSFSAPLVSGVAAGLAAVGAHGDLARAAVIAGAARPWSRPYGAPASGSGRADAAAALRLVKGDGRFAAVTVQGGAQVAAQVGRRTVEVLAVGPRADKPLVAATAGTVKPAGGTTMWPGGPRVVRRVLTAYRAPAHDLRSRDARVTVRTGWRERASAWVRVVAPVAGPEGAPAVNGATSADRLTFGSRSRVMYAVSLAAGQTLTVTATQPEEVCPDWSPSCNPLLVWSPERGEQTASASDLPEVADMGRVGTYRLTAKRAGRYLVGMEALSPAENGLYRFQLRWANPVMLRASTTVIGPAGGAAVTATVGLASGASGRLLVDVFGKRGSAGAVGEHSVAAGEVLADRQTSAGRPGATVRLRWDGRDGAGRPLPDGVYTLRARLITADGDTSGRTLALRLDRALPRVLSSAARPDKFFPAPDGYRDTAELRFRASEALASAVVEVFGAGGRRVWTGRTGAVAAGATGMVRFKGLGSGGGVLPTGRYTFAVTAVDLAGNRATGRRTAFYLQR